MLSLCKTENKQHISKMIVKHIIFTLLISMSSLILSCHGSLQQECTIKETAEPKPEKPCKVVRRKKKSKKVFFRSNFKKLCTVKIMIADSNKSKWWNQISTGGFGICV